MAAHNDDGNYEKDDPDLVSGTVSSQRWQATLT